MIGRLVDEDDFDRVMQYEWHLKPDGYVACSRVNGRQLRLHQLVLNHTSTVIEHKNRDKRDCRKSNLQRADQTINNRNKRKSVGKSSGFKGVSFDSKWSKFVAQIGLGCRKSIRLGAFDDEIEAAKAYDTAARTHFGSDARLNFPKPGEKSCLVVE